MTGSPAPQSSSPMTLHRRGGDRLTAGCRVRGADLQTVRPRGRLHGSRLCTHPANLGCGRAEAGPVSCDHQPRAVGHEVDTTGASVAPGGPSGPGAPKQGPPWQAVRHGRTRSGKKALTGRVGCGSQQALSPGTPELLRQRPEPLQDAAEPWPSPSHCGPALTGESCGRSQGDTAPVSTQRTAL